MIAYIKGEVLYFQRGAQLSTVDVLAGNIGYRVFTSGNINTPQIGDKIEFFVSPYYREDNQALYGFKRAEEKAFFEILIGVSGVGPKSGLSLLSLFSEKELRVYIMEGDHKALSKASGVGPKLAKKIILELSGILTVDDDSSQEDQELLKELKNALKSLGFTASDMDSLLELAKSKVDNDSEVGIEELLQFVLKANN